MAEMHLDSCHNRHRAKRLTSSKKARGEGYQNIHESRVSIKPRTGLTSDITFLKIGEEFMYHCCDRKVLRDGQDDEGAFV